MNQIIRYDRKNILENLNIILFTNNFNLFIFLFVKNGFNKSDVLIPANGFVNKFIESLRKNKFVIPYVADENYNKAFCCTLIPFNSDKLKKSNRIFIASAKYHSIIEEKLVGELKIDSVKIINTKDFIENLNFNHSPKLRHYLDYFSLFDFKKHNFFRKKFDNSKNLLVVFSSQFSDEKQKVKILVKKLNANVVFINQNDFAEMMFAVNFIIKNRKIINIYLYITSVFENYVLASTLRQIFKKHIKLVLYVYDYLPFLSPRSSLLDIAKVINVNLLQLEREYEAALNITKNMVDILIYKDKGVEYLHWENSITKKLFFPAFFKNSQCEKEEFLIEKNRFQTLYIGNLIFHEDPKNSFTKEFDLISAFNKILDCSVTVNVYYNGDMSSLYQYYSKINNVRFTIKNGLPMQEFITSSNECYGWGLCLVSEEVERDVNNLFWSYAFPSKISAYIALGIPIIVSEQLIYCAQIVQDNNIGIIIKKSDTILEIKQKIETVDLKKLYANMKQFQVCFAQENMAKEF